MNFKAFIFFLQHGTFLLSVSATDISVPQNFSFSFVVHPKKASDTRTSIFDFKGKRGSMPGIFFRPNSTTLDVRITLDNKSTTKRLSAKLLSSQELPLNAHTTVRVEAFGRDIYLFLNNSFDSMISATKERYYGNAAINPLVDDFIIPLNSALYSMTPITSNPLIKQGAINGAILKLAQCEAKIVPANFALSFNIKPTGKQSGWSNVVHLVGVGEKESIAAVYFRPGSLNLVVTGSWADKINWNECLSSTQALPLNSITNVRLEVFGLKSYLFLNNTYNDMIISLSMKKDNQPAILYVSDPWTQPSKANIDSVQLNGISAISPLPQSMVFNGPLSKEAIIETTLVPENYRLSFDITPTNTNAGWGSIIHYSGDNSDMGPRGRIPAIWIIPGSTRIHVRFATNVNVDEGFSSAASLPMNQITNVLVLAIGKNVILYLNNTVDSSVTLGGVRYYGQATLYISNHWHAPALASIGSIQMTPPIKPSDFYGPLSRVAAFEENVIAPENYSLSFDITPTGTASDWSSIIHYSGDKSDVGSKGRMPAIWFFPQSTRLEVRVSTANGAIDDEGFISNASLPLNRLTEVRVEAVGNDIYLFLNNKLDSSFTVTGKRQFGAATLYVSAPWYNPALATVGNIQMKSITAITTGYEIGDSTLNYFVQSAITNHAIGLKTIFPRDYSVSYNIRPSTQVSGGGTIIKYGNGYTHCPGMRFHSETKLQVIFSTNHAWNEEMYSSVKLPVNQITNVRVVAFGKEVFLFLNNTLDIMKVVTGDRAFGTGTLFLSESTFGYGPALASIDSLRMTPISGSPFGRVNDFNGPLSKVAAYEKTNVPENYNLSFSITPTNTIALWGSIIHYSGDNSDMGPIGKTPAIFFQPGSTRMEVRFAINVIATNVIKDRLSSAATLPINQITNVLVSAIGKNVILYLNNTVDSSVTLGGDRYHGQATLYVSNPWHAPALASIGSIQMKPI